MEDNKGNNKEKKEVQYTDKDKELIAIDMLPEVTKLYDTDTVDILDRYDNKKIINVSGNIKSQDKYFIYTFKFRNQENIPRYLFTNKILKLGHNDVSLRSVDSVEMKQNNKYDMPEDLVVERMCKEQCISGKMRQNAISKAKEKGDIIDYEDVGWELLYVKNAKRNLFYTLNTRLTKDVKYYFDLGDDRWFNSLLKILIHEKGAVDDRLFYLSRPHLVKFDTSMISPKKFMRFAPHMVWITNPGTGKTSIATKIGICVDKCKVAGLLGYSDAKNIRDGSLNGREQTTILDELQSEKDESLFAAMNSYEEQGTSRREMGMKNIKTQGYSPLIYISNPKPVVNKKNDKNIITSYDSSLESIELLNKFNDLLSKITDNSGAFGRRKGVVLFSEDIMKVTGNELPDESLEVYQCIVDSMFKYISKRQTRFFLLEKIQDWLQKPMSEKNITFFRDQIVKIPIDLVSDFWNGYIGTNKHIRGIAYRQAVIDNLFSFRSDESYDNIDIDKFIRCADKHYDKVLVLSLKSLSVMTNVSTDFEKELMQREYKAIDTTWIKYLLFAVSASEKDYDLKILPFSIISKNYVDSYNFDSSNNYRFFSRIESNMHKAKMLLNANNVLKSFGVELLKKSDSTYYITIIEETKLKLFNEILRDDKEFKEITNVVKSRDIMAHPETLLDYVDRLKDETGLSQVDEIVSELKKLGYVDEKKILEFIEKFKADGTLHEPRHGYIKR